MAYPIAQKAKENESSAHHPRLMRRTPDPGRTATHVPVQQAIANPEAATPAAIQTLQQLAGNSAVTRLIQAKLTVGAANDAYEQEADRVAAQVLAMPAPAAPMSQHRTGLQRQAEEEEIQTKPLAATITPLVQRQAEEEEIQTKALQRQPEEEEIQTQRLQRQPEEEEIQTKRLQRQAEEEEIQTKSLESASPMIQRLRLYPDEILSFRYSSRGTAHMPAADIEEIVYDYLPDIPYGTPEYTIRFPVRGSRRRGTIMLRHDPPRGRGARHIIYVWHADTGYEGEQSLWSRGSADSSMNWRSGGGQPPLRRQIQRQSAEEEEIQTKRLQRQPEEEEIQTQRLQRQGAGSFDAGPKIERQLAANKGSGSALPGEVRAFMEPRFGTDFSGVRVHTGNESAQLNRALNAQAFTHGKDIYLGAGQYDPGSPQGKQLLAHELTHVVQQTGKVQPRIQRWSIGGWFSKKGHEIITQESVEAYNSKANTHNATVANDEQKLRLVSDADLKQLKKGARWNDLLGHWGVVTMGLALFGSKKSMTHQSHEGQLQFLHGMASSEAEAAWKTQHKIMLWAEFCYKVSTGVISGDTKIRDVQLAADQDFGGIITIANLFAKWGDETVSWLFTENKSSSVVGMRALGSMMHMLQDTFCASHTQRMAEKRNADTARKIKGFNVYTEQSASIVGGLFSRWKNRHGIADKLNEGNAENTAGAKEAKDIGAKILQYYKAGASWGNVVKPYLKKVFGLTSELEAQKPTARHPQPEERLTSASGRLFRKTWLYDQFKSNSSVTGKKRPGDLKAIDAALLGYKNASKLELDQISTPLNTTTKQGMLLTSKGFLTQALQLARAYVQANHNNADKNLQTRVAAANELITELNLDKKEIDLDLTSIRNKNH